MTYVMMYYLTCTFIPQRYVFVTAEKHNFGCEIYFSTTGLRSHSVVCKPDRKVTLLHGTLFQGQANDRVTLGC